MLTSVIDLLFWFFALVFFSFLLDMMWARSLGRWIYIVFSAPGIVVHELSHYLACRITGAKVTSVKLITLEGGSVTHGKPTRGGVIGQALISMAPFFGIPLFLILLALLFNEVDFFNCDLIWDHDPGWNVGTMLVGTFKSAYELIKVNLVDNRSLWFLLYLYLAASLTTALAPSKQDFRNSWIGLVIVIGAVLIFAIVHDNVLKGIGWEAPLGNFMIDTLGWIVAIGLVLCLFGLILSLPFFVLKRLLS